MINNLKALSLKKSYKDKTVVKDISISVNSGEVIGLLGPNGAGKTTSFYMIVGLVKTDSGKILLNDNDITTFPMYERSKIGLGYLPQENSVFRGMTVENNILSVLEIIEKNKRKRLERLEELLTIFSIQHIRKSVASTLSGGERRRTEIARALASDPKFILLDEPFAGIDPIAVSDIIKIINQLKNMGIGVLITDHNVRETLSIVDVAYIVYDGYIIASGSASEIIDNKEVKRVYLGENFK